MIVLLWCVFVWGYGVWSWESSALLLPLEARVMSLCACVFLTSQDYSVVLRRQLSSSRKVQCISALCGVKDMEIKDVFHGKHGAQWTVVVIGS